MALLASVQRKEKLLNQKSSERDNIYVCALNTADITTERVVRSEHLPLKIAMFLFGGGTLGTIGKYYNG